MQNPQIAISDEFLSAFAALPRQRQGKMIDFLTKFRTNPRSPAINYEKVHAAFDPNIRSVRIDDTYRGILLQPEKTGVYILLWVDHHDRAYEWACRKRCKINRSTGSVQIFEVTEKPARKERAVHAAPSLFASLTDEQLFRLGVPKEKVEDVRGFNTLQDLYLSKRGLPEDAYEGLEFIASGFDAEEVLEMFAKESVADLDPEDFSAALLHPRSKKAFTIIAGEAELLAIMSAPLEKWRVFLHPTQRRIAERDFSGPARVTGGAGTGKTVVAMHRAKWLAGKAGAKERILFTTFTSNLASDIQENLRKICTGEELKKIEVTNIDAWVFKFLRESGSDYSLMYGDELDGLWEDAINFSGTDLGFPLSFYKDEWSGVVNAYETDSLAEYIRAPRPGRGIPLSPRSRIEVWKVFEEYRGLMLERKKWDIETAMSECRKMLFNQGEDAIYSSIIVDEGQDLSISAYRLLRTMAGKEHRNDLFIVGDSHQRIYNHRASLAQCGINIRGRSSCLRVNYRTTEEIRKWAFSLLQGIPFDDLDQGVEDGKFISLVRGKEPLVKNFADADREFDFIFGEIQKLIEKGHSPGDICIVARTRSLIKDYRDRLNERGCRVFEIRSSKVDNRSQPGVRIATMHRVKGLEFEHVFVASANAKTIPLPQAIELDDPLARASALIRERSLLYVAVTRAKQSAYITSHGGISEFVSKLV